MLSAERRQVRCAAGHEHISFLAAATRAASFGIKTMGTRLAGKESVSVRLRLLNHMGALTGVFIEERTLRLTTHALTIGSR